MLQMNLSDNLKSSAAIICIDIGGTIEDTWEPKCSWFKQRGIYLSQDLLSRNEIEQFLGSQSYLYQEMTEDVYSSEAIFDHSVVKGAVEAIKDLSKYFRVILLSTRPANKYTITINWLNKVGLKNYIYKLEMKGEKDDKIASKLERCVHLGAVALIDDDIHHLTNSPSVISVQRILLTYPKKGKVPQIPGVFMLNDWNEIYKILDQCCLLPIPHPLPANQLSSNATGKRSQLVQSLIIAMKKTPRSSHVPLFEWMRFWINPSWKGTLPSREPTMFISKERKAKEGGE